MAETVNIPVSISERDVIDRIRKIEREAYAQGFKDGAAEANRAAADELDEKLKRAYQDGKAKAHREIQIGRLKEETDKVFWIPGDKPDEEGEYIVTASMLPTPIALHYSDGEWQAADKIKNSILAYRKMPEPYKED